MPAGQGAATTPCPARHMLWAATPALDSHADDPDVLCGSQASPRRAIPTARLTPCASWHRQCATISNAAASIIRASERSFSPAVQ